MTRLERWLIAAALCCCALWGAGLAADLWGAPAPFAKRAKPQLVYPGKWSLKFNSTEYLLELRDDGTQRNNNYTGSWSYEKGVLAFTETTDPSDPRSWKFWWVKLEPDGSGNLCGTVEGPDWTGTKVTLSPWVPH